MKKKRTMKKKKHWFLNILILLLVVVGLALIFNKPIRNMMIANKINSYQVSHYTAKKLKKNTTAKANYDFEQVKPVDVTSVVTSQATQNFPVIGGLAIPDVKINLPIFLGVDSVQLNYGAGTMKENQVMGQGNYALAAHHVFGMTGGSDLLFSPLDRAKAGMKMYLTDKSEVYEYTIDKVYTVEPEDVAVIEDHEGQSEMTLVTCTDIHATARIIVHGNLDEKYPFNSAPSDVLSAFEMKYNQFQS
ncbi:MAG: class A sortase [Streptococcaceae bacterium]|jgi:sortase A|nr:class A sortase [Streptococcaceae bacterium]